MNILETKTAHMKIEDVFCKLGEIIFDSNIIALQAFTQVQNYKHLDTVSSIPEKEIEILTTIARSLTDFKSNCLQKYKELQSVLLANGNETTYIETEGFLQFFEEEYTKLNLELSVDLIECNSLTDKHISCSVKYILAKIEAFIYALSNK